MSKLDKEKFVDLRERAERVLTESPGGLQKIPTDVQELIHELQVRSVELEIQNEQLRETQLELQQSHDRYVELYDFAPVGYLTMDSNGFIVQANLAVCALLKTQRNVLLTQPFNDYVKASQRNEFENHLSLVSATLSKQTCELELVASNRSEVDVEMLTVPIDSPDDDHALWYRAILTNIGERKRRDEALQQAYEELDLRVEERTRELVTMNEQLKGVIRKREQLAQNLQLEVEERKKIEGVLRESEELFRRTFDEAPIGAAIISTDFRFKRVNSALCSITGYSQEELESLSFMDITHPEDRADNLKMAQKLASGELRDYQVEKRYIQKEGKIVWVRASIEVMRDEAGEPIYYLPMTEDITEKKKVEIKLRESEEKYRLLIQNLPGVVYKGQRDWSVEFFDEKAERFTGYKVEEFCSGRKKWSDLIPEEDFDRAKEPLVRALRTDRSFRKKWSDLIPEEDFDRAKEPFVRALRTDRSFVREYRIRCKDGKICWVQDRGTIVCDEKGEILSVNGVFFDITERKKLDEQLLEHQRKVRSMTSELALTEERQRRDLAQDLHDSIGQTLALSKLRVDSMRYGEVSSKISPELEALSRNLEDAIEQTQSLIFRLSPPVLYQVGLSEALEYLTELMETSYGIPIAVSSELNSLLLPEDESVLLFRAVQELLINIVKHAGASRSSVTLKRSDNQVQVEVQDDGVGFDTRLLSAQGSVKKGFGLLNIRERLHNLGGHMEVQSSPGGGTKVSITAPLPTETGNTQ
jgi:PAS domain S-box-containing protein